jgi:predicted aldo/keto reductase-like oxidoreductase
MERAKADGRIRHLGFSFHDALKVFKTIVDGYDWEFCQIQFNLMDGQFQAGSEGLAYAGERGIGAIAMEPLRGGTLAVPQPEEVERIWARSPDPRPPAGWALRWVWDHPEVITALSGMNADYQLRENLAAADEAEAGSLSAGERALVEEVRDFYAARMRVPCTTCGYCAPCASGVAIPEVFAQYNTGAMFGTWQTASGLYELFLRSSGRGGDQCRQCGLCEPRCPQNIPIMDKLREAVEALTGGAVQQPGGAK